MRNDYDFHFVSLSCSFLPDKDCRFVWARFGVQLSARSKTGAPCEKPIAYDMFPQEVISKRKYIRKVNFSPGLKFSLGMVDAGIKLVEVGKEEELLVYEPQIFAYGINTAEAIWNFKSTKEKTIWGNKKDLLLVVKAPKNSKVKGRFFLGAEVEFNVKKWIPIPLSKRKDEATEAVYVLSK